MSSELISTISALEKASDGLKKMGIPQKYQNDYEELIEGINTLKNMNSNNKILINSMIEGCKEIIMKITNGIKFDMQKNIDSVMNGLGSSGTRPSSSTSFPGGESASRPSSGGESYGFRGGRSG